MRVEASVPVCFILTAFLGGCGDGGGSGDGADDASPDEADTPQETIHDAPGDDAAAEDDLSDDTPPIPGDTNTWIRLEDIRYVFPSDYTGSLQLRFWCDFTWDPDGGRILFYEGYGGDHLQTGGSIYANAVYALDPSAQTVTFIHLALWDNPDYDTYVAVDGVLEPHPRHTYGGFIYVPEKRSIYMAFGACEHAPSCQRRDLWRYDIDADTWILIEAPLPDESIGGFESNFAYLPGSGRLWLFSPDMGTWINIYALDLTAETWSTAAAYGERVYGIVHAAADPVRGRILLWTAPEGTDGSPVGRLDIFDPAAETLSRIDGVPADFPAGGAMAYIPPHDAFFFYSPETRAVWIHRPAENSFEELPHAADPGARIDRYLAYDPVHDLIATFTVDGEFYIFRYAP